MKLLTVKDDRTLRLSEVKATNSQAITVEYGLRAYGYLLTSRPPASYTLSEVAQLIAEHYDGTVPQTAAVLRDLDAVQAQTEAHFALTESV